jgi:hypothetical protein
MKKELSKRTRVALQEVEDSSSKGSTRISSRKSSRRGKKLRDSPASLAASSAGNWNSKFPDFPEDSTFGYLDPEYTKKDLPPSSGGALDAGQVASLQKIFGTGEAVYFDEARANESNPVPKSTERGSATRKENLDIRETPSESSELIKDMIFPGVPTSPADASHETSEASNTNKAIAQSFIDCDDDGFKRVYVSRSAGQDIGKFPL